MAQQLCVLGGVTFDINPYPYSRVPKKTVIQTVTQGGTVNTIWQPPGGGLFVGDQPITMSFAIITRAFYDQLYTLFGMPGTLSFSDPDGVLWTVIFADLTPQSLLKGGDAAIENVQISFQIVSQP